MSRIENMTSDDVKKDELNKTDQNKTEQVLECIGLYHYSLCCYILQARYTLFLSFEDLFTRTNVRKLMNGI